MSVKDGYIGNLTKIIDNGDPRDRWNLVIMGDGYQASEIIPFYHNEVGEFVDLLSLTKPFDELWHAINIYRLDVISTESGADDPETCAGGTGTIAATYFDSTFCFDGTARRILAGNEITVMAVAEAVVPEYHTIIVLVNTTTHGGSAGLAGWCSTGTDGAQIAIHELGHAGFDLGDEYGEPSFTMYTGKKETTPPNLTTNADRNTTKWAANILPATSSAITPFSNPDPTCSTENSLPNPAPVGTVGLFEGGSRYNCGIYHAEYNCKMRTYDQPFCSVCQQRIRFILNQHGGNMSWESLGNSGTDPAINFLGTKDNQPLIIKTNRLERLRITANGIGINDTLPTASLSIVSSTATRLTGSVRSATLLTSSGTLGGTAGNSLSLASIGFFSGNNSFLGIRALRVSNGISWETSAIGLGMDVDNTPSAGANLWLHGNGNIGIGTTQSNASLSIVSRGAAQLSGSVRSASLLTSAGTLGTLAGNQLALASIGFQSNNNSFLGIRALRVSNGRSWETSAIGLGMDVDDTVCAGANLWLHGNGNIGMGTTQSSASLSIVAHGAAQLNGFVRSASLLISAGTLGSAAGNELCLASIGFQSSNNSFLGIRALRVSNGTSWETASIGIGMDVDNTVRAGANLWLHGNGNIGIGKSTATNNKLDVLSNKPTDFTMVAENTGGGGAVGGLANGNLSPAVAGHNMGNAAGVHGYAAHTTVSSIGVIGTVGGPQPYLIDAFLPGGVGVLGYAIDGVGTGGVTEALHGNGVEGHYKGRGSGAGVLGMCDSPNAAGIYGQNNHGDAGRFIGDVSIQGRLTASSKTFRIDHPLDPANKYLNHACIESADMMNIYNGNIVTDKNAEAAIQLPMYFDALNRDFKYQLTVIGDFAQAIVAKEIRDNVFIVRTDRPGVKVSWQVTGIRKDPYAEHHPVIVEEEKPADERGKFLYPELYKPDISDDAGNGMRIGVLNATLPGKKVELNEPHPV